MQSTANSAFHVVQRTDPERASLEAFIVGVFRETYGASVTHFAQTLLGWKNAQGQWQAALGYTVATSTPLFVEHYSPVPIDVRISRRLGATVQRNWLVEVGNLAAVQAGAARELIAHAILHLHQQGHAWVVFTATRALLNSFERLDVKTIPIGPADPARLPDGGASWGRYYATQPAIMTGSITLGYVALRAREQAERIRAARRAHAQQELGHVAVA